MVFGPIAGPPGKQRAIRPRDEQARGPVRGRFRWPSDYDQHRMAAPPTPKPEVQEHPKAPKRTRREQVRTGGMVVLAILLTLFAAKNFGKVKVDWIFGSGHAPLIIVIVISVLVGIVLAYLAERLNRRRRR
jgi:uncharacterized integral membrane protein